MKVKTLYGCLNTETGELLGVYRTRGTKYAFCQKNRASSAFSVHLRLNKNCKLVKFIPEIIEDSLCQEQ